MRGTVRNGVVEQRCDGSAAAGQCEWRSRTRWPADDAHTPVSFSEDITTCDLPTPKDLGDAAQAVEEVAATKSAARQGSIIIAVCLGPEASHPAAAPRARGQLAMHDGG